MEQPERSEKDYLKDLETIKDVMIRAEDRPLFEQWAFYVWGLGFIAGTLLQHFIGHQHELTAGQQFTRIWIPVLLVLGLVEVVSLVRTMSRQAITVYTKSVVRLYVSMIGASAALLLVVAVVHKSGGTHWLPIVYVAAAAVVYFLFALTSYPHLTIVGYAMIILGSILVIFAMPYESLVLIAGIGIGTSCIAAGIADRYARRDRTRNR